MKEQDFELLSQYLDGELDLIGASVLERRLAEDSELKITLEQMRSQNVRIQDAFAGTDKAPAHVQAMLEPASNVVALSRRTARPAWQYAVAASLVAAAGLLLTPDWNRQGAGDDLLARVLEHTPSMASGWETLEDGRQVRPVLSFRHTDGHWCREYLLSGSAGGSRGVACRDGDTWQTAIIAEANIPGDSTDYRPAGAGDAEPVARYLAESADGIALSAAEEAELIANDWK